MPRLPSGLMFGFDSSPFYRLFRETSDNPIDARLQAIERTRDVSDYVDVIYFDEVDDVDRLQGSSTAPHEASLIGRPSGLTLAQFRDRPHSIV